MVKIAALPPGPHRPLTMGEVGDPPPVAPEEPGELVEAEVAMQRSDDLARKAGVNLAVLAETERQERK